ncbi:MAG: PAS domain S-box protein [Helicobacteraceae bacterium]|nr:PAS domain S-box protein [Helicobacteraceae bacterium]
MKSINFAYESKEQLKNKLGSLSDERNILIQIFDGKFDVAFTNDVIKNLIEILPHSEIMLSSSIAGIADSSAYEGEITICVSIFKKTTIKVLSFCGNDENGIAKQIVSKISKDTKLLILFGDKNKADCKVVLDNIALQSPETIVSGGVAGDDLSNSHIYLGDKSGVGEFSFVCAMLDSPDLKVYTDYIFEFINIGTAMTITSIGDGGIVKTINNIPVREIYRKYLGDLVADNLPMSSFEFPLTLFENGMLVGKAVTEIFDDGSARYSSDIKLGSKVGFGVRSIIDTTNKVVSQINNLKELNIEGIYLYLCITRYIYFKTTGLQSHQVEKFDSIAPSGGFFAYGEFFHSKNKNHIFNVSSSLVALSEGCEDSNNAKSLEYNVPMFNNADMAIHAISYLAKVANDDYRAMVKIFGQYKELLEESSMILYINKKGIIVSVNEVFLTTSKYQKSDVIGERVISFISNDSRNVTKSIWDCIKDNKTWRGNVKNIAKGGGFFYTKTIIKPIIDADNNVLMYICSMDDVTEYELKNQYFEHSIHSVTEMSVEKEKIIEEYQDLLDKSTAMIRIKNGHFVEVNQSFEQLFGYTSRELVNKHFSIVLDASQNSVEELIEKNKNILVTTGFLSHNLICLDKNRNKLHIQAYIMRVNTPSADATDIEFIGILHNVTEIFEMQEELINVQKEVIYAMGSISEGRSRETGNHVKRVAEYSYLLAKLYGLDEEQAKLLKIASPMHDIGKLAIPDAILNKPGKLTDEEFNIMKTHAQQGCDMLRFSDRDILKASAEIALTHHEWWNGCGYPNKLSGEDIPLFGRITAVADVFDALSHDRCYKKAWPIEDVVEHMLKLRDVQFQGKLVDLLVENLDKFIKIKDEFVDKF